MFGHDHSATFNTLIATTLDSVDGYRKAAEKATNPRYTELFTTLANEREQVVRGLQNYVSSTGGNPEDDGTILAAAHRAFLSLRDAVTGSDDAAILAEVERGEDYLKGKYDTALAATDLKPEAKAAIDQAYASVKKGHDRIEAMRGNA